jgi:hypothetical protein
MARLGRLGLGRTAFKVTLAFCTIMALVLLNPFSLAPPRTFFLGMDL